MNLSKRMETIAHCVTKGHRLADVGTDHCYIPIYLVKTGVVPTAIAMDINMGPLKKAQAHIQAHHLADVITTRLSNGLEKLNPGEVDTVVIAGMGGALMSDILNRGLEVLTTVEELILQPQSEISQFRHFLHEHDFSILEEYMISDEGKHYVVIKAGHGQESYDNEVAYIYGKKLLEKKDPVLYEKLQRELKSNTDLYDTLKNYNSENAHMRLLELEQMINMGKEALTYYEV